MDLTGKVAIVTGGAQGIGRAICLGLAEQGVDVAIVDLKNQQTNETAKVVEKLGRKSLRLEADVSSEESVKGLFTKVVKEFGAVDILVNNAGICRMTPILEIEVAEWDKIMAVNLRGTFLMCREAFKIMKEKRAGKIINIASAAAKIGGLVAGAHYSASKAGVMCFTKSLALQAAPYKINVNAVAPGPTATEMTDAWGEKTNKALADRIPWKEYAGHIPSRPLLIEFPGRNMAGPRTSPMR